MKNTVAAFVAVAAFSVASVATGWIPKRSSHHLVSWRRDMAEGALEVIINGQHVEHEFAPGFFTGFGPARGGTLVR